MFECVCFMCSREPYKIQIRTSEISSRRDREYFKLVRLVRATIHTKAEHVHREYVIFFKHRITQGDFVSIAREESYRERGLVRNACAQINDKTHIYIIYTHSHSLRLRPLPSTTENFSTQNYTHRIMQGNQPATSQPARKRASERGLDASILPSNHYGR